MTPIETSSGQAPVDARRSGNASGMDDDGTLTNRLRRDGAGGARRGASQTHGASDPSGVDAEPDLPAVRLPADDDEDGSGDASPPSEARRR